VRASRSSAGSLAVGSIGALSETSLRRIVAHLSVAFGGQSRSRPRLASIRRCDRRGAGRVRDRRHRVGRLVALSSTEHPQLTDLRGLARQARSSSPRWRSLRSAWRLPPTIAFFARLAVFEGAAGSQLAWLVIVAAGATVLGAASGFRIVFACFEAGDVVWPATDRHRRRRAHGAHRSCRRDRASALLQLAQGVRF